MNPDDFSNMTFEQACLFEMDYHILTDLWQCNPNCTEQERQAALERLKAIWDQFDKAYYGPCCQGKS